MSKDSKGKYSETRPNTNRFRKNNQSKRIKILQTNDIEREYTVNRQFEDGCEIVNISECSYKTETGRGRIQSTKLPVNQQNHIESAQKREVGKIS